MKKILFLFYILPNIIFAQNQDQKKYEAENYYYQALNILKNDTDNALSIEQANEALRYACLAVDLNPEVSKYYRVKATAYYHLKSYESALINYNQAIRLDSNNLVAWMGRGNVYDQYKNYEEAEKSYLIGLKIDSTVHILYLNLGLIYDRWGKDSLAEVMFGKVIELQPKQIGSYLGRGYMYIEHKKFKEAILDFEVALELDKKSKIALNNIGLCNFYLEDYKKAIKYYKKSLSIDLGDAFNQNYNTDLYTMNNLANTYFKQGNTSKACEYWQMAIDKGYKYQPEWKEIYNIDDPVKLIEQYCK